MLQTNKFASAGGPSGPSSMRVNLSCLVRVTVRLAKHHGFRGPSNRAAKARSMMSEKIAVSYDEVFR